MKELEEVYSIGYKMYCKFLRFNHLGHPTKEL